VIAITEEKIELVQKFVDAYHTTQDCLDSGDVEGATARYRDLLDVYKEMAASKIDPMHKELAYDQLVKVYQGIQNPPQNSSIHATTHIIAAAVLLVLFSFMVFFRPAIFGAATLSEIEQQTVVQDLNIAFVNSGSSLISLDAMPKSMSISGKVDGDGFVRVYAVTTDSRTLLFDRDQINLRSDGTFSAACVNTCNTPIGSQDIILDVELENAALTIYSIEYKK
jgi:hypothetical protein